MTEGTQNPNMSPLANALINAFKKAFIDHCPADATMEDISTARLQTLQWMAVTMIMGGVPAQDVVTYVEYGFEDAREALSQLQRPN